MNDPLGTPGDPHKDPHGDPLGEPLGNGPPASTPTPGQVRDLLLAEALTHRPDADRILARVARERGPRPGVASSARARRRGGPRPASLPRPPLRLGLQLASAAAVAGLVVTVAVTQRWTAGPDGDGPLGTATVAGEHTSQLPSTSTSGAGPSSTRSGTATAASGTTAPATALGPATATVATPPATGRTAPSGGTSAGGRPTGTGTAGGGGTTSGLPVHVTAIPAGTAVDLPRPGDRDWLVLGGRNDGRVVRMKAGTGEIGGASMAGEGAAVAPGPLLISWQGGSPEQDHTGAGTWWTVPAGAGRLEVVVRLARPGTVELYVGVDGVPAGAATVAASLPRAAGGGAPAGMLTGSAALPAGSALVSLTATAVDAGQPLTLVLAAPGTRGTLAVSAVAVR